MHRPLASVPQTGISQSLRYLNHALSPSGIDYLMVREPELLCFLIIIAVHPPRVSIWVGVFLAAASLVMHVRMLLENVLFSVL